MWMNVGQLIQHYRMSHAITLSEHIYSYGSYGIKFTTSLTLDHVTSLQVKENKISTLKQNLPLMETTEQSINAFVRGFMIT